ncbi:MAG: hypothetical protein AAFY80_17630, partial [Pseudomonadota bacterium]
LQRDVDRLALKVASSVPQTLHGCLGLLKMRSHLLLSRFQRSQLAGHVSCRSLEVRLAPQCQCGVAFQPARLRNRFLCFCQTILHRRQFCLTGFQPGKG